MDFEYPKSITGGHKNISTFSNLRHFKIYPNRDFWFENKPSGNPGLSGKVVSVVKWRPRVRSPRTPGNLLFKWGWLVLRNKVCEEISARGAVDIAYTSGSEEPGSNPAKAMLL
jgi:hypothetical protein